MSKRPGGDFSDKRPFPTQSRVVIIGGGVVGCSVAYHLAKMGWGKYVVLVESGQISCGTTWHAAGLIGQMRSTASETQLSGVYGCKLYSELEAETGVATGFRRVGSLTLARTLDRLTLLKRNASRARAYGIEAHIISGKEAGELWQKEGVEMVTEDLVGALWLPGDGTATSTDLCASLASGAKQKGVRIFENARVSGVEVDEAPLTGSNTSRGPRRIKSVKTSRGEIQCEIIVNTAGQWARQVGAMAGVNVPLHSAEHFYIVSQPFQPPVTPNLPVMRDPDVYTYYREWSGGLVMGGFEPRCKPVFSDGVPEKFEFALLQEDWEHFSVLMPGALERVPALETAGVRMVNGPESFTPDNQYILGEAPELRKYYVAAGFNSSGIASAGGAGRALAEWIVADAPTLDLWAVDIRRFGGFHSNVNFLRERTFETLGLHYQIPWPKRELESARPLRRSPLYQHLLDSGAYMGSKYGWERPNYYDPAYDVRQKKRNKETPPTTTISASSNTSASSVKDFSGADPLAIQPSSATSFSNASGPKMVWAFGKTNWFPFQAAEHRATRERVALFDQSSFVKYLIQGRDACTYLQYLCANDVDVPDDRLVYTTMLNDKGGIETDCTITRLAWNKFLLVTSTAQGTRDRDWIERSIQPDQFVTVTDVTSSWSVLSVMGPRSRELLQRASDGRAKLNNEHAPFGSSTEIEIGFATVRANRVTYVGELGWELYVPTEFTVSVYEKLWESARADGTKGYDELGMLNAGYFAIDSLRLEKGYRAWGHDLSPMINPYEAGLGFAVKLDKSTPFKGQEALKKYKQQWSNTPPTRMVSILFRDSDAYPLGDEPILRNGELVGYLSSAGFGHTLGRGVGLGYVSTPGKKSPVTKEWLEGAEYEVEVHGKKWKVDVSLQPFYDPKSTRIKM